LVLAPGGPGLFWGLGRGNATLLVLGWPAGPALWGAAASVGVLLTANCATDSAQLGVVTDVAFPPDAA
jgi:hypothetical protein